MRAPPQGALDAAVDGARRKELPHSGSGWAVWEADLHLGFENLPQSFH